MLKSAVKLLMRVRKMETLHVVNKYLLYRSKQTMNGMNKNLNLPNEILLWIFDHLPWKDVKKLRLVCRNFRDLALRSQTWKRTRMTLTCANYKVACHLLKTSFHQVSTIKIMIPTKVRLTPRSRNFEMKHLLMSIPETVKKVVLQDAPTEKRLSNPPEMQICGLDPDWFADLVNKKFDYVKFIERGYKQFICETILTPEQMRMLVATVSSNTQLFFGRCW